VSTKSRWWAGVSAVLRVAIHRALTWRPGAVRRLAGAGQGPDRAAPAIDWRRVILLAGTWLIAASIAREVWWFAVNLTSDLGGDLILYQVATRRWLAGGGFYQAYQLAGPYDPMTQLGNGSAVLYPPVTVVLLLVPATVLPVVLWYAIPLGITAAIVWSYRPSPLAWLLIAAFARFGPSLATMWYGNPGIWVPFAVALALRYRWVAALVLLKPSLFPFAFIGVHDRRWWIAVGCLAGVSLVLLPMDLDWTHAVLNAQGERSGLLYSLRELPMAMIPIVAWLGRKR
jgi:hypothetical protein